MDIFAFWVDVLSLGVIGILQMVFVGRLTGKRVKLSEVLLYLILVEAIETIPWFREWGSGAAVGLAGVVLWGISWFLMGNGGMFSGVAAVLAVSMTQLSFGLTNSLDIVLFLPILNRIGFGWEILLGRTLFSLLLNGLGFWLILRQFDFPDSGRDSYVRLLLPSALFFLASELYLLNTAYTQMEFPFASGEAGRQLTLLGLQVLGLGALFGALYAYREACSSFRAREALAALAQESRAQRIYVEEAQARYRKTEGFRHDIRNHLSVLDGLLKTGKWEEAKEYLEKLNAVSGELSFPVHTGNPAVDILLGDKGARARAEGTRVETFLSLPKVEAPDWDLDLCVIFANALDNAIRACKGMREADKAGRVCERNIRIRGERQGDFYWLTFENPCEAGPEPVLGTGLSNIRAAAEKYGGTMTAELCRADEGDGAIFRLDVLLNLSLPSGNRSEQKG